MSALGQKQTCDVMPSFGRPGQKATNLARVLSLDPIVDNWLARYPFRGSEYINCVCAARFYFPLHFFACRAVPRLKRRNALKIGERWLACGVAMALFFVSLYVFLTDTTALGIAMAVTVALTAVVVWFLGWAFRYTLSST
jgi:hypothetical protein